MMQKHVILQLQSLLKLEVETASWIVVLGRTYNTKALHWVVVGTAQTCFPTIGALSAVMKFIVIL